MLEYITNSKRVKYFHHKAKIQNTMIFKDVSWFTFTFALELINFLHNLAFDLTWDSFQYTLPEKKEYLPSSFKENLHASLLIFSWV